MKVLLSIKPEFADRIFAGEKRFEYRKAIYRNSCVQGAVVYATRPVGMIVGEFEITRILTGTPEEIWGYTFEYSGISRAFYDCYYEGRNRAFALEVGKVSRYSTPLDPGKVWSGFVAPQSFMYISPEIFDSKGHPRQFRLPLD
jgi:predicted transcriptional regulator